MDFTVAACGFRPRCTLEHDDASQVRIEKIYRLSSIRATHADHSPSPINRIARFCPSADKGRGRVRGQQVARRGRKSALRGSNSVQKGGNTTIRGNNSRLRGQLPSLFGSGQPSSTATPALIGSHRRLIETLRDGAEAYLRRTIPTLWVQFLETTGRDSAPKISYSKSIRNSLRWRTAHADFT